MIIRNAEIEDTPYIAKNNIFLAQESENKKINYDTVQKGVKAIIKNNQKGFYIVAEKNKKIIGQIMVTYEWSDWKNKSVWWIQSIYVLKEWREKGVLKNLLKTLKKRAIQCNVTTLKLYVHRNNVKAKQVYKKLQLIEDPYQIYKMDLE